MSAQQESKPSCLHNFAIASPEESEKLWHAVYAVECQKCDFRLILVAPDKKARERALVRLNDKHGLLFE